jgi:hypothetical protein
MKKPPPLAEALQAAAGLIAAVIKGRTLDAALARTAPPASLRAATMDLAYTTLRAYGRGDFLLGLLLDRPLKDATARGLLLAALARLEVRAEDAHTTVDQAVTAAAGIARGQFKGLVNGVLRSFLRRRDELLALAGRRHGGALAASGVVDRSPAPGPSGALGIHPRGRQQPSAAVPAHQSAPCHRRRLSDPARRRRPRGAPAGR